MLLLPRVLVQPLVRELRSLKPCSVAKKKKIALQHFFLYMCSFSSAVGLIKYFANKSCLKTLVYWLTSKAVGLKKKKKKIKSCGMGFPGGAVVKNPPARASLVVQWLRICLPMQGTRVRALVWEDPTCHGATRPVSHNC